MQIEIINKKNGARSDVESVQQVSLDHPSVIRLKLSPENVARYVRRGDDLILMLKDGQEIAIAGFFTEYPAKNSAEQAANGADNADALDEGLNRNELVLEDSNGVLWWGQYPEQWSEFHFTEIEWGDVGAIWLPWLLGAVGAGGVIAAASGGSSGGSTPETPKPLRPPVATDDAQTVAEDNDATGNVLTNDSDPDGDALTVTTFTITGSNAVHQAGTTATIPNVGTITLNANGGYVFSPAPNWNGTVPTITYTISDGQGGTDTATLTLIVTPVADLTAEDDSGTTQEDIPLNGTVATNDSTTSGGTLTFTKASDPTNGTVIVNPDGIYTYTPNPNYNGPDSFTYTVTDPASGESLTKTVTITVTPVNDDPEAQGAIADQNSEDAQSITSLDIASYFSDIDGDTLTYTASGLPDGLSIDKDSGQITGTINPSASQNVPNGAHNVTIVATDPSGKTASQTFTWTVTNPAPLAADDVQTVAEDKDATGNVLTNDSDPDGDALTLATFTVPGDATIYQAGETATIPNVGTITLNADGGYVFSPVPHWNGAVPAITYTITDSEGGTDTADLNIIVTPVADLTADDDNNSTQEDTPVSGTVATNDSTTSGGTLTFAKASDPANGTVIVNPDGTYTYTPNPNYNGSDSFTYTVTDPASGESLTKTVTIIITPVVDLTAGDDSNSTLEDTPVSGTVATNDSTTSGGALTFAKETDPANGTVIVNPDGAYTYTPNPNYNGSDSFTYTVTDPASGESLTKTVTITITPVNDDPDIAGGNQTGTVIEAGNLDDGTVVAGTPTATGKFAATDVDGDTVSWSITGTADTTYGQFSIDPATGAWTYALDNSKAATQALNEGDSIPLTYTVEVSDGNGGTATRTVTITIRGTNDSPVAVADTAPTTVKEAGVHNGDNTPTTGTNTATGNVLTNDTDVDDGEQATLTVSGVSANGTAGTVGTALQGTYGSLTLSANGTYSYALDNGLSATQALKQGQPATETFTYIVRDAYGATSSTTLTINIEGTNDVPVITSGAAAALGEVIEIGTGVAGTATASGTLTATDVDTDATQTWSLNNAVNGKVDGTYGSITIDPVTGKWTYTLDNDSADTQALNTGESDIETFTARVMDEFGAYSDQIITITVRGSNDDLEAGPPAVVTVTEDVTAPGTLQDYISDLDDTLIVTGFKVDINGSGTATPQAVGSDVEIKDANGNLLGTLNIAANGAYSFTPGQHYSGNLPTITYTMKEDRVGGKSVEQTLNFNITKVSDAPGLEANKTIDTPEDTAKLLGLKTPTITDTGTGTGLNDYPERIGEITLTIGGVGKAGVTLSVGSKTLTPVADKITIIITDVDHITGLPAENPTSGIYHLTRAEYEGLMANPKAESGDNFTVRVDVSSYEVNAAGDKLPTVAGAPSNQTITVNVQAVTDGADLALATLSDAARTFAEDTIFNLSSHLTPTLTSADSNPGNDTDGSEEYWYEVSGLPIGSVVTFGSTSVTITAADLVAISAKSGSPTPPSMTIKPPLNFSGDMEGITVTLKTQDTDADSTGTIAIVSSPVALNLYVTPVAGDVAVANPAATPEDTLIKFLTGVSVTDTGAGATGTEVITSIAFDMVMGWILNTPPVSPGWTFGSEPITGRPMVTFDASLTQAQREDILDGFTFKPPPHSSKDAIINLTIKSVDTNTVNAGVVVSPEVTTTLPLTITVTPAAERTDTNSDGSGGNDVTMIDSHAYTVEGNEDEWFALGQNYTNTTNQTGGIDLRTAWTNADPDEYTYAVLTPELAGDAPGDTAIGTTFRFQNAASAWVERVYTGEAIWIPTQFMNTLQVKLPQDVSGTMAINVQAGTVDYDDDAEPTSYDLLNPPRTSGPNVSVALSGAAQLTFIKFNPVADEVTMAVNGKANGLEDTEIPLSVKATTTDPSETITVTISGIPAGATIIYKGVTYTPVSGAVELPNYDNRGGLSVKPPLNSNENFTLKVEAKAKDGPSETPLADIKSQNIVVEVTGVADAPFVNLPVMPFTTTENILDASNHRVSLSNLVTSVTSPDTDGSEKITLRITGLSDEFSITGATMVTTGTGAERVWVIASDKLANVSVILPNNYSGTVNMKVAGVTTENDGSSYTGTAANGGLKDVSFTVTPSAEAIISDNSTLIEDQITLLGLSVVHQNGDNNEVLSAIYVPVTYDASTYTLFIGNTEISAAGLATANINGVVSYVIPQGQIGDLGAKGAEHLGGAMANPLPLDIQYAITDPSNDGTLTANTVIKNETINFAITAITDAVKVAITGITVPVGSDQPTDEIPGDDANPDTAHVKSSGVVSVNLHVTSVDNDGSEHLVRVLIEGVPDGVAVNNASQIGTNSWLLIYEGANAKSIGVGGLDVPVDFIIGQGISASESNIKMTVLSQDDGNLPAPSTVIETDVIQWKLIIDQDNGQVYEAPTIDRWNQTAFSGTEDTSFALIDVIDAGVTAPDPSVPYSYTVSITDLPSGTIVSGMILTNIDGIPTWTATTVVLPGQDSQTAVDNLLAGIRITSPANSNDNNAVFDFNARLTAAALGGNSAEADVNIDLPIIPVTDPATISVTTSEVAEGQSSVSATISASSAIDGIHGQIVDGKIYVQIANTNNPGGTVADGNGTPLTLESVTGVSGISDGNYYVIDVGTNGGSADIVYTAPTGTTLRPGDVTFTAFAKTQEDGAAAEETASGTGKSDIIMVNNGVTMTSDPSSGNESSVADKANAIELQGLSVTLNDSGEDIHSIMLTGVPEGFLLYVGDNAGNATLASQASNAGGDGTTNAWIISTDGTLPLYVAILPPVGWSGTVNAMALQVESGETSLPTPRIDTQPVGAVTVNAVANGLTFTPSLSFGKEGAIIDLNLNASMVDAAQAEAGIPDASVETTTLQIKGLGAHAVFYIGDTPISAVYGPGDVYTLTGLTQPQLDDLGFVQAVTALSDQDAAPGTQIEVTAFTVESATSDQSTPVTKMVDISMTVALPTNANDIFLWKDASIDGMDGIDTVSLYHGDSVSSTNLAAKLRNIEVIDLSTPGENNITGGLSIADVLTITGKSSNAELTIKGDAADKVALSSASQWSTDGTVVDGYVIYTGTNATLRIDEDIFNNNNVSFAA